MREMRQPMDPAAIEKRKQLRLSQGVRGEDFCVSQNGECLPEVCNEFCGAYWAQLKGAALSVELTTVVELCRNFNAWVFREGFSCSKIALI